MIRRYLHIAFPQLALDRHMRADDPRLGGPFAITQEQRGAFHIVLLNKTALSLGCRPQQSLADARAICPDLLTELIDAARDKRALQALRRWADRFSPVVEISEPDGLVLDITGVAHLFEGEAALCRALIASLDGLKFTACLGIAQTPLAARAVARFAKPDVSTPWHIVPSDEARETLSGLPVEALELDCVPALLQLGFLTIGEVMARPAQELSRRFGLALPDRLSRLFGTRTDPLRPNPMNRPFATRMSLPEPIGLMDDIVAVLRRLIEPLVARMERDGFGARVFRLSLTEPDKTHHSGTVGFSRPCRDTKIILRQFQPELDGLSLSFGVETLRLEALSVQPLHARQIHLGHDGVAEDAMSQLVTVLGNRLGFDRITRPAPSHSHRPEKECVRLEVADQHRNPDWPKPKTHRPLRLICPEHVHVLEAGRPPKRFQWRGHIFHMKTMSGPERIAPEWWSDDPGPLADYYTVQTEEGQALWLRRLPKHPELGWDVTGIFA